MKTPAPDDMPTSVITDPVEIASIRRSGPHDIIGGYSRQGWYAYDWSLARWRGHKASATKASWWRRAWLWLCGLFYRELDKP